MIAPPGGGCSGAQPNTSFLNHALSTSNSKIGAAVLHPKDAEKAQKETSEQVTKSPYLSGTDFRFSKERMTCILYRYYFRQSLPEKFRDSEKMSRYYNMFPRIPENLFLKNTVKSFWDAVRSGIRNYHAEDRRIFARTSEARRVCLWFCLVCTEKMLQNIG